MQEHGNLDNLNRETGQPTVIGYESQASGKSLFKDLEKYSLMAVCTIPFCFCFPPLGFFAIPAATICGGWLLVITRGRSVRGWLGFGVGFPLFIGVVYGMYYMSVHR